MQADILDLQKSGRKFDIIESIGVLHHMEDPMAGFKVLVECLKPGGLLKIGLYSELARKSIVEVKKRNRKIKYLESADEILSFRNQIIKSDKPNHKQLQSWRDFYSLSELKDLIFHVQEHRFTIPKIKKFLKELQLNFCGFGSDIAKGLASKMVINVLCTTWTNGINSKMQTQKPLLECINFGVRKHKKFVHSECESRENFYK